MGEVVAGKHKMVSKAQSSFLEHSRRYDSNLDIVNLYYS